MSNWTQLKDCHDRVVAEVRSITLEEYQTIAAAGNEVSCDSVPPSFIVQNADGMAVARKNYSRDGGTACIEMRWYR